MSNRVKGDVLLVGSMPFDTSEETFRACAEQLRGHACCLPDGEVGIRTFWVGILPKLVYSEHPDLEETLAPPDRELHRLPPDPNRVLVDLPGIWSFRVRPQATLRFDDLLYGDFAVESYAVFRRLRDEGVIAADVRFQVCIPSPHSAIDGWFEDPAQWPEVHAAYREGIKREIDKMLATIPAEELVIQRDAAWEFVDMATGERNVFAFWPKLTPEQKFERHAEQLEHLGEGIPDETLLGIHWCYGTFGGWPMTAMSDLDLCVRMSNEAKRRIGRRLDYIHMPVVQDPDDAFFAPLDELDIGETELFLGMVHHTDGIEQFRYRRDLARAHRREFGIGSVCGYGHIDQELLPEILRIHRQDAAEL